MIPNEAQRDKEIIGYQLRLLLSAAGAPVKRQNKDMFTKAKYSSRCMSPISADTQRLLPGNPAKVVGNNQCHHPIPS